MLSVAVLATCTSDRAPTGPGAGGRGYLAIRPVLASPVNVAAFGLTIDSLRVAAIRPVADTVVDTTVFFDPNAASLSLSLSVPLVSSPETFVLLLQLRAGTRVLFSGLDTVQVTAGPPDTSSAASVTLKYTGPGAGLTSLHVAPVDSVVREGQSQQFRATADSNGVPVDSFYVSWSSSNAGVAPINGLGLLQAPNARGSVFVRGITPNGVKDSTRVTFVPVPVAVAVVSGSGQSGVVAARLPLPLRARVTAADNLGVKGVPVRFQALTGGGSVRDSVVITDSLGFAEDSVSLGTVTGAATFQASVTGLAPAPFTATATAGAISAAQSIVSVSAPTLASGAAATLALQAKDVFGNTLTSGGAIVVFTSSGGTSTGSIGSTTDNGNGTYTAAFTGVVAGSATTIGATVNGTAVTTTLPTLAVTAGGISAAGSIVSVSSATVASGGSITLTLQAKDAAGNTVTTGGATVVFSRSGGTSTGTIGATTDHADGTYTATFTGNVAGTPTTVGATINGAAVTTALPTVTVTAGAISAATSLVTTSSGTVAAGAGATLTLQAKDATGNNLTTGGATVVFTAAGGTSVGTIGATTDHGDGTYSATFTGVTAGTATTLRATVNGVATTSTTAITVVPGNAVTAQSIITVSADTVIAGGTVTLTLQAKDSLGNNLTAGGLTVVFTRSGGTSVGTIGPTTDHNNGTYTAIFTATVAGTATTIGATIGGAPVTSTLPGVTVIPGAISTATSLVTVSAATVASGAAVTLTLQAKDAAGNNLTKGGAVVAFTASGGTSTGVISATTDHNDGTYTATLTGVLAGTAATVGATIGGTAVTSTLPTVTVTPGGISIATSVVTASDSVVQVGATDTLFLRAKDAAGNLLTTGGALVAFTQTSGAGVSAGAISSTTDLGTGRYRAIFTGSVSGTPTTIGATISGVPVSATPLPTIRVSVTTHTVDITADSTWTAAASPHIVNGYLRIRSGATLTIQPGALVEFNAGSGLQVGDTAANQAGALVLDGTAAPIVLTANTASPAAGFWRGIEVQRSLPVAPWRKVTIEYGGGARAAFGAVAAEACVLFVNRSGAQVDLDSVRIRQCIHAGIHHFGGTSHVHRSEIDTVSGSGVHVDFDAQLELDSTTVRFAGQEGLFFGSPASRLLPSSGNQLRNNAVTGIHLKAVQLPGLLRQDSIVGNATNFIVVDAGQVDPSVAAFTIFAQPQPVGLNGYLIQNGLLDIGRVGGQALTLDSNVVLRFTGQTGLVIGDSAGTRSGTIVSLGTNRGNAPRLTSASLSPAPGDWYGLEIGRLSTNTRLANVRVEFAGDSIPGRSKHRFAILIRSPAAQTLALDSVLAFTSGHAGSDTNTAGIGVLGSGSGVDIRRSVAQGNLGYGFALGGLPNIKVIGDTAKGNGIGFVLFSDSGVVNALGAGDSVANNVATGNTLYPLQIDFPRLPTVFGNTLNGNGHDTVLVHGGGPLTHDATMLRYPGVPWRVTEQVAVDSDAVLTLAPLDTVAFDDFAGFIVGSSAPAALRAVSTGGSVLLTATPGQTAWHGVIFAQLSQEDTLTNVVVEKAGYLQPCFGDCSPIPTGAIWFQNPNPHGLTLDSVTVRHAPFLSVRAEPGINGGSVKILNSQFYDNTGSNAFYANRGSALTIDSSDIYHYRRSYPDEVIVNNTSNDSVVARHNWWGDVSGPGLIPDGGFSFQDSIGRAMLFEQYYNVAYVPFATAPHFPLAGPVADVVGAPDSILIPVQTGSQLPDSVRVRVIDAFGRGISGQTVTWSSTAGNGTLAPTAGTTDIGGRTGAYWTVGATTKTDTAKATSGVGSTHLFVDVLPGPTTTVSWELLPSLTQGTVSADSNTVVFTSTGRRGVIVTHAFDANGNPTQPAPGTLQFEDVPTPFGFQSYGVVDSTKADTIFFHATVTTPAQFQLHATYTGVSASFQDSVFITMNAQAKGLRISQDTAQFNSLCPTGPTNFACSRVFFAQLLDSAGTPLPPTGAFVIQWAHVGAGTAVTLDSVRGVMGDIAYLSARANGSDAYLVHQVQGPFSLVPSADTLAITVQQVPVQILVNPVSTPVGLGDTVTFSASVGDAGGGAVVPSPTIHWRADPPFGPYVKFIDTTSVAGTAKVRVDSVYRSFGLSYAAVTAFAVRPPGGPGDTLSALGQVVNPIQVDVSGQGANPVAAAVNSKTGRVYVVNAFTNPGLVQVFDSSPKNIATVQVDMGPHGVAVDPVRNRVYVANQTSETMSVIDGATNTVVPGFIALGPNSGAVAVDTVTGLAYATGQYCFDFPATCSTPFLKIIGSTGAALVDSIQLPADGRGVAVQYNAGGERLFVSLANDTVVVVNPSTKTIVDTIAFPSGSFLTGVAVNSITKRVYVAEYSASQIGVIDGAPGVDTLFTNTFISVNNPNLVSVNEKRNLVYSAATSNTLVVEVDGTTNSVVAGYFIGQFGDFPLDAAINAADQRVYVPHGSALTLLKFFTH